MSFSIFQNVKNNTEQVEIAYNFLKLQNLNNFSEQIIKSYLDKLITKSNIQSLSAYIIEILYLSIKVNNKNKTKLNLENS